MISYGKGVTWVYYIFDLEKSALRRSVLIAAVKGRLLSDLKLRSHHL
jgi:hypothetical protein